MVTPRQTLAQQRTRRAELDAARLHRQLTADERAEADTLTQRLYMREWRRTLATPRERHPSHAA